jgi:23S rRNA (pseudouridine1915-N3)-methyltransferase
MFKVKVLSIGKCKEEWLGAALNEYEKRLKGKMSFEWVLVKTGGELAALCSKEPYIALDPKGTLLSSEEWSEKMVKLGLKLCFVIGGAIGLDPVIIKEARFVWSLSPLTFTHQMTRLILVEQLYRAIEIEKGSSYHKI